MSFAEPAAETDTERILRANAETQERVQALTDAVNGLGQQVQWIVDQAKGIFQMFGNPAFMAQLPNMMGGVPSGGPEHE